MRANIMTAILIINPHFVDMMAVATGVAVLGRLQQQFWFLSLLLLPGTIGHELMHWLAALLLNGRPGRFSVWPHRSGNEWVLGEVVTLNPRWYNMALIALAPLALLPLVYWGYFRLISGLPLSSAFHWLGLYAVATLIYSAIPSRTDCRVVFSYPAPFVVGLAGGGLWYFFWRE